MEVCSASDFTALFFDGVRSLQRRIYANQFLLR